MSLLWNGDSLQRQHNPAYAVGQVSCPESQFLTDLEHPLIFRQRRDRTLGIPA
ncbi:MAG: hypothetical protein HY757_10200 [Nitrospirae bacterium]|nr:hypothetical protein [Nitrospirota bacterium]